MSGHNDTNLITRNPKLLLPEAILSILIGGFIYIIFRTDSLVMFNWFKHLHLSDLIYSLRHLLIIPVPSVIKTLIYTAPGGLWTFSYIAFLLLIWNMEINRRNIFYFIFIPVTAIASEFLQLSGFIAGTFNYHDITSYMAGAVLPLLIHIRKIKCKLI